MIEPYYTDKWCTIYHGDCLDIMPQLESVDLVLTDPPYNVGINYGDKVNDNKNRDDFLEWIRPRFKLIRTISQTVLITGQIRLTDYASIEPWKWLLCWWKPAAMGRSPVGFCNWEPIAMWGKGNSSGCDFIKAPIKPSSEIDGHPCPKPLAWSKGQLLLFPQAHTILDPFMGSGTTLVAAKQLNKKAIGIEIEKKYCDIAVCRLAQEVIDFN